jgi:paired amphipathic helix protein Sin3a
MSDVCIIGSTFDVFSFEFRTDIARTIERICHLFGNDPVLIQEFSIFLPRGYQLECSQDANGANYITITTPGGTTTQTTNNASG